MVSVCYILSYYSPNYIRTRTLVKAFQLLENTRLYQCRNTSTGLWRYFQTITKLIATRVARNPDVFVLGFRGYEHYLLVRVITIGKPLILDHMMSPYDSLIYERKSIDEKSWIARSVYFYEKLILNTADIILTDTENHKSYFHRLFNLDRDKIIVVPVGADEDLFYPRTQNRKNNSSYFEVLFYGSFLPLHGIEVVLRAARLIQNYPIRLTLIGGQGTALNNSLRLIEEFELANVQHIDWINFEKLPEWINNSAVGLGGPFGNTGQAKRVITGKTFQFLAMGKPVLVGEIDYPDSGFKDKYNCLLVPQGDERALADAILWAFEHQDVLSQIGQRGYELYHSQYSINRISEDLQKLLLV